MPTELILQILNILVILYFARAVYRKEKAQREPVYYMVTYVRWANNALSYGSLGIDVKGGINQKNIQEVMRVVRDRSGFPDAFIMSFSSYAAPEATDAH